MGGSGPEEVGKEDERVVKPEAAKSILDVSSRVTASQSSDHGTDCSRRSYEVRFAYAKGQFSRAECRLAHSAPVDSPSVP